MVLSDGSATGREQGKGQENRFARGSYVDVNSQVNEANDGNNSANSVCIGSTKCGTYVIAEEIAERGVRR